MAVIGIHWSVPKALRLALAEFDRRPSDPSKVTVDVYTRGKKLPEIPVYPVDSTWPEGWRRG